MLQFLNYFLNLRIACQLIILANFYTQSAALHMQVIENMQWDFGEVHDEPH